VTPVGKPLGCRDDCDASWFVEETGQVALGQDGEEICSNIRCVQKDDHFVHLYVTSYNTWTTEEHRKHEHDKCGAGKNLRVSFKETLHPSSLISTL